MGKQSKGSALGPHQASELREWLGLTNLKSEICRSEGLAIKPGAA
jgi:hypothetical protein